MIKQCSQCKTINANPNLFCVKCGIGLSEPIISTPVPAVIVHPIQPAVRPRRRIIFGLASIVILLILGAVLAFVFLFSSTGTQGMPLVMVKELTTLNGNSQPINTLSWSSDGKTLAAGAKDGSIRLWSATGQPMGTMLNKYNKANISELKWSPDNSTLVSASTIITESDSLNDTPGFVYKTLGIKEFTFYVLQMWDVKRMQLVTTLPETEADSQIWEWSPDNQVFTVGKRFGFSFGSGSIEFWNVKGNPISRLDTKEVYGLKWAADGKTLAVLFNDPNNSKIVLFDSKGKELNTICDKCEGIGSAVWSPDGRVLAVTKLEIKPSYGTAPVLTVISRTDNVELRDTSGKIFGTVLAEKGKLEARSWSPDSKIIAIAYSYSAGTSKISLWNTTGQQIAPNSKQIIEGDQVIWSPDSQFFASYLRPSTDKFPPSDTTTIWLWNSKGQPLNKLSGHKLTVTKIIWSPDSQLLASMSEDNTVCIWDAKGQKITSLTMQNGGINDIAWSPDGKILASASNDGTVKLWSITTSKS